MSDKEVVKPAPKKVQVEEEPKYVIRAIHADKYTVVRKRVLLTPAVCEKCGVDLCELNGLPPYDELDDEQRLRVESALARHMKRHSLAEEPILTKKQIENLLEE